jgi:NADP-dependent 3-hydroxy acid dehydrogenase YdfG
MYYTLMKNSYEDDWEQTVDVLCKGMLNCVGAVLPGMLARGRGHIVTISSDAGRKVFPGLTVYSGSKFFVEAVSQGLRLETAGTGLRVTTIQPGNVATDLPALSHDTEALERYGQPGGARILDPEDVAASILHVLRQPDHVAVNEILVEPRDEPV